MFALLQLTSVVDRRHDNFESCSDDYSQTMVDEQYWALAPGPSPCFSQ
jgi:hypothetical protein